MTTLFQAATILIGVIVIPGLKDPFVFPKWSVGVLFAALFLICLAAHPVKRSPPYRTVAMPFAALWLAHIISVFVSGHVWSAIETIMAIGIAGVWLAAGSLLLQSDTQREKWALSVSITGIIVAMIGIGAVFGIGWNRYPGIPDPSATFGHRNLIAQFLIIQIPISLYGAFTSHRLAKRITGAISAFSGTILLVFSACRGAWIGMIGGTGLVLLVLGWRGYFQNRKRTWSWILLGLIMGSVMAGFPVIRDRWLSITDIGRGTNRFRVLVWSSTCRMIQDAPVWGIGAGNFQYVYPLYRSEEEIRLSGKEVVVDQAHNDYLQVAAETGVFGFLSMVWLLSTLFHQCIRIPLHAGPERRLFCLMALMAIGATAIHAGFSSNFRNPVPLLLIAALSGSLLHGTPARTPIATPGSFLSKTSCLLGAAMLVTLWGVRAHYEILVGRGTLAELRKDYPSAARYFTAAHRWFGDYDAGYHAGFVLSEMGDYDQALQMLRSAHKQHPAFRNILFNMGVVLEKLGMLTESVGMYQQTTRIDPVFPDAWNNLGVVLNRLNRLPEAQTALERGVREDPWSPDTHSNLGIIYYKLGQFQKAMEQFQAGVRTGRVLFFERSTTRHLTFLGKMEFRGSFLTPTGTSNPTPWGYVQFPARPEFAPEIQNPPDTVAVMYSDVDHTLMIEFDDVSDAVGYILEYRIPPHLGRVELNPVKPIFADLWNNIGVVYERQGDRKNAEYAFQRSRFIHTKSST